MKNQIVLKGNAMKRICFVLVSGTLFPKQNVAMTHKIEEEVTGKFLCFIKNINWGTHCGPPMSWMPAAG